ncbi:Uncharacterised protein [Weeksella virosa]|nr:Uncharacterised protein [Weeksella virosa]VEH63904.1 Uncharacterised protein [Weeksella virosa]
MISKNEAGENVTVTKLMLCNKEEVRRFYSAIQRIENRNSLLKDSKAFKHKDLSDLTFLEENYRVVLALDK